MLLQGNRLESLRALLTTWMQRQPLGPLENEVVLVQSNGIAQWLKLALASAPIADGGGIAAALDLTLPARFIWQAYRAVLDPLPEVSAYDKAPLTWRLYRLLGNPDQLADDPAQADWLRPLTGFLSADADPRRRQQLAARLADLYDQYQVYRADWLGAWQCGRDLLTRADGSTRPLPAEQRWQPVLWRRLHVDLAAASGDDPASASRADVHQRFLAAAQALTPEQRPAGLPRRVIVFGISALPRQALEVLEAIAHLCQVMLFVHNPSQHDWGNLCEGRELFRRAYRRNPGGPVPADLDESAMHLYGHPLLAAWGKQGRDYIRLLDELDRREQYEGLFNEQNLTIDLFESPGQATLMQQLQDDILELRPLAERQALGSAIDPAADQSLGFLVCHGPQREVEVLHDQLLAAFAEAAAAGAPLQPRDVLVMVPAIDTYAPHIQAVFGRLPAGHPRHIPFHLSDQGSRQRQPLLIGVEALLGLPEARFAVSEVLDLLDLPALRARFRIDAADLSRLRQWISGANIRWGLDAEQRAGLGLPAGLARNTWQFGLQRMLLGFAAGAAGPWQGIEPYDEVGGLEAALVGPLTQLLATLADAAQALAEPRTPPDWAALLAGLLDGLFQVESDADDAALALVLETLDQWVTDCALGGLDSEPLPLAVVREALLAGFDAPRLSQRFLAGAVNFATLLPMRAIPFRQIWLLGMNDGDYPRAQRPPDFDLMATDYRPGDRSRREDDRYLFLEALLSARERLMISWVGRSIQDNSERPPSVLVGQLRDHLAAGWRLAGDASEGSGARLLAALTTEHPLQPFSRRYFEPARPAALFTYADEWRSAHAAGTPQDDHPPRLAPPAGDAPLTLALLGRFLRHPVREFYRQRLAVAFEDAAAPDEDDETFALDGLGAWAMRDAAIADVALALHAAPDRDPAEALHGAIARLGSAGDLPLAPFDGLVAEDLQDALAAPLEQYRELLAAYNRPCPPETVSLTAAGLMLTDTIADLRANAGGQRLRVALQASGLGDDKGFKWYNLVRHWPLHLAAQLGGPTTTRILGPETDFQFAPLDPADARAAIGELLAAFVAGQTALPPLACKTGLAWLLDQQTGKGKPREVYEGGYTRAAERDEHPGLRRFWPDFQTLAADPDFARLVEQCYGSLLAHCQPAAEA